MEKDKGGGAMAGAELSRETEQTVSQARLEAVKLGHAQVGSEHLFLALLVRRGTEAAWLLGAYGWEPESWRRLLHRERGIGAAGSPLMQGLSDGARDALRGAVREAGAMGMPLAMPEHLLLALLRQEQTLTARLLRENGTCADCVFSDLIMNLHAGQRYARPEERSGSMRLLEQFCTDMVASSVHGEPVIGREEEIEMVMGILCRKNKNNLMGSK